MTQTHNHHKSESTGAAGLPDQAASALRFTVRLPFRLAARLARHTIQVLFAIFVVILHPQAKWLFGLIARSALARDYIKPSLRTFVTNVYEPYFAYLGRLSPYWATFSIAVPLTILEPAKFYATILIAERPKTGVVLWLALQGLSLILIDRTWTAVRPQSRKIWFVSRIHAWGWLNAEYGKFWIRNSPVYRMVLRWKTQTRRDSRSFWSRLTPRRRKTL
jgi:hypothetical protein